MAVQRRTRKKTRAEAAERPAEKPAAKPSARKQAGGGRAANSRASGKKKTSLAVLFWLGFAILMCGLFLFNRETISESIATIRNEMSSREEGGIPLPAPDAEGETGVSVSPPDAGSPPSVSPAPGPAAPEVSAPEVSPSRPAPDLTPPEPEPSSPPPARSGEEIAANNTQAARPSQRPETANSAPGAGNAAEMRDRALYFTQVDRSGTILRIKTGRKLPLSASPMTDVLQALITGPTGEEQREGLISLIPPESRLLSATVRGNTAYINFSEDFQYNTYGVEGYAGQLRQIIFTVTEFPNVRDVQILIEGQRVDYLGEGIWIGSPLSREML